ncbi:hypothetical protein I3842_08G127300 [Carya illinoinensis]|uniref:Uncharacterized protein n=1 Tax=Carya illinoinensis TaxID=32201 RepID=A0A922JCA4_CARIL|nr:hypothetical protein I3842_08G127300 [Carya illinoinensis]
MVGSNLDPPFIDRCCIYKIPTFLHRLNEKAYTPEVISIGPFHHGQKSLESMEKLEVKYFKRFLQQIHFNMEILVNKIQLLEEEVRGCYAKTFNDLTSDDFVKLILVDGCFLIEFFNSLHCEGFEEVICENRTLLNPTSFATMMTDFKLLENQLPLFVLQKLSKHAYAPNEFPQNLETDARHFVNLARVFLLPSPRKPVQPDENESNDLRSANHLYPAMSSSKCLLYLKFIKGTFEIPCMTLYDSMETIYRNIIAFEQCHYPYDPQFTNYIGLLNFLINTPKDVDLLTGKKKIIINWLGSSDAVASFVNNLDTNVVYDGSKSNYRGLFQDLNAFFEDPKHTWKATLKRDYFSTPWGIASTAAAVILLLLTLGQFICSIIQVVKM